MILMLSSNIRFLVEFEPFEASILMRVSAVAPLTDNLTCVHGLFTTALDCPAHKSGVMTKS